MKTRHAILATLIWMLPTFGAWTAPHAAHAGDEILPTRYWSALTFVNLDSDFSHSYSGGAAQVDFVKGTVTLTLTPSNPCDAAGFCLTLLQVDTIELPIVETERDACGTTIIRAERDLLPVDGTLHEIEIQDHRGRVCKDVRRFVTEIEERITTPGRFGPKKTFLNFYGGTLLKPLIEPSVVHSGDPL